MGDYAFSEINYNWLLIIIIVTLLIVYLFSKQMKSANNKLAISFITFSVFFYSGLGIALNGVDNKYICHYAIYIFFLLLPFLFLKNSSYSDGFTYFDEYILEKYITVKRIAYLYLLFMLLPCIYPEFKLGNILNIFSAGNLVDFFDKQKDSQNIFGTICDNISMILSPAFFIYLGLLVRSNKNVIAVILVILHLLLNFCQLSYLGRYKLMIYGAFIIFILFPPLKDGKFVKKSFLVLVSFVISMLPLLYLFVFFRLGNEADSASFLQMAEELLTEESFYPVFYDKILSNNIETSLLNMIFWIILLPIPSLIFPYKPAIDTASFTYLITGLRRGDAGFSILLPSVLGESFSIGGQYLFFVHAFIIGCVYVYFLNFISKHKTLQYLFLYYLLSSLVLGRGGAGSFLPTLINCNISIIIFYFFKKKSFCRQ